jgi:hypothetical protein
MNDNPFRRRPFVDIGIDVWKLAVLAVSFIVLALWMLVR